MNVAVPRRRPDGQAAVLGVDLLVQPADVEGGLEEVLDGRQALARAGGRQVAVDPRQHLMGGGQAAGRLQHEGPVVAGVQHVQLAVGPDVVDAGVGAGVGRGRSVRRRGASRGSRSRRQVARWRPAGARPEASPQDEQAPTIPATVEATRMPILASSWSASVVERQAGDEERDGEPDAGERADADDAGATSTPGGRSPMPQPHGEPREGGDADQLADDEPDDDAVGDRRRPRVADSASAVIGTPGVGEGEQRHDDEARPRVQAVLEPLDDGHRATGQLGGLAGVLGRRHVEQLVGVDQLAAFERARSARAGRGRRRRSWRGCPTRGPPATGRRRARRTRRSSGRRRRGSRRPPRGRADGDEQPRRGRRRRSRRWR